VCVCVCVCVCTCVIVHLLIATVRKYCLIIKLSTKEPLLRLYHNFVVRFTQLQVETE